MAHGSIARRDARARLATTPFDVVVLGGGLVGAGTALDASARGLRTALLEPDDFGAGDCSRGSDLWPLLQAPVSLLHPRHLLGLVEAAAERQYLRQIAPHLIGELPIVVPTPEATLESTAGVGGSPDRRWPGAHRWLPSARRRARRLGLTTPVELAGLAPALRLSGLAGGWVSTRVQVDEAVLALALARTAAMDGAAVVLNHVGPAPHPPSAGDPESFAIEVDGSEVEVQARVVVDARGGAVRDGGAGGHGAPGGGHGAPASPFLRASVPRRQLPVDAALVLWGPAGSAPLSIVPAGEFTRLGMVGTPGNGPVDGLQAMLATARRHLTVDLGPEDVTALWEERCPPPDVEQDSEAWPAGSGLSKRHPLRQLAPGWLSVRHGTVTTYRELARQTVDAIVDDLDERTRLRLHRRSLTHRVLLRGASGWTDLRDARDLGPSGALVEDRVRHRLAHRYGSEARVVLAMLEHRPDLRRPLVEGLPYLAAEAVFAVRYELAGGLVDVLARRAPALLEDAAATAAAAEGVAALLGPEMGWDARRRAAEVDGLRLAASCRVVDGTTIGR